MAGNKDPAIKLFGKTIQLNSDSNIHASKFKPSAVAAATTAADSGCTPSVQNKNVLCSKQGENRAQEKFSKELPRSSKIEDEGSSSSIIEDYKTPPSPSTTVENTKKEDHSDQMSSTRSQDQTPPKKPDRILPCPRCNSMNTKFCYFNNYNVNQPRHFCKNCQRYWTAGGTMRNVPVGAGRRKNKNSSSSASHPRPFVIPEPQTGLIQHVLRPNGAILAFEPNLSLSKPMVSTSSHGEKPPLYWESKVSMFPNQAQPTWASSGTWNIQWVPTPNSYLDQSPSTASSNSLALGKHDRNGTLLKVCDSNKESGEKQSALVTKTIKIDDPTKTAKSSIWDTLGIRSEKVVNSSNNQGFFGGFGQSKGVVDHDWKNSSIEGSCMVLQANPAAFSRSLAFHESAQSSC